ncbi:uncharacterized protein P174DRAFT_4209 [Aspergillus novofumigatus IBT 16806]|uniref:Uncharacterized protein n=1 Tax=Aspergillus novofumigatus (strain IBT 16806) TaxID=1392255 RepID=A0A2I1CKF4_ASPN1|nr:uncharacterized protein P174DRAFT_4209 [Aspergillus novofumigatus IBT 16806]PKX98107.1 hypothetical protein P174DRAFT_4209 [Aspergillus novofumigatus IBT 16806]
MALMLAFFLYPFALDLVAVHVVCKGTLIVLNCHGIWFAGGLDPVCLVQYQCLICNFQWKRVYWQSMIHAKGTGFIREYISNARLDPPKNLMTAQTDMEQQRKIIQEESLETKNAVRPSEKAPE